MAEQERGERAPLEELERVRAELERMDPATREAEQLVERELRQTESAEDFQRLRRALVGLVAAADSLTDRFRALVRGVDVAEEEWIAEHRYSDAGLEALEVALQTSLRRPSDAARRWLNEILDALRASELDAAVQIAEFPLGLAEELEAGRELIRTLLPRVRDGDAAAGLELMEALASSELTGWQRVLDATLRGRAYRLAGLYAMRVPNEELAREHVDAAVEIDGQNGINYAERAAYWLFVGDFERAAADAQQAVELAPDDPAGHLMLGLWSELTGEFEDAEEHYVQGLERMTIHAVSTLMRRASLIDPSGLQLAIAGEHLLAAGRREPALEAASAALAAGVRGRAAHADARVYRLRRRALELPPEDPLGAAEAGVEAGKRLAWNGDGTTATHELRRALELDFMVSEARWLLADALVSTTYSDDTALADAEILSEARKTWDESAELFGLPHGSESWAYLTRAILADLSSQHPGFDRRRGQWEAVIDCERALVHNDLDGARWGFAARYIRALGLEELAFEAVERGYELSESNSVVLEERLALLSNRGCFPEAAALARDLVASYGDQVWVAGVQAWLALHEGQYEEGLTLVDLPLSHRFNLSWYYDLRALCHLKLGDVEAARRDFLAIVAGVADESIRVTDASVKVTLAVAYAIAGDLQTASHWVEDAQDEVTATDDTSYPATVAFVALAADELEQARAMLRQAVTVTKNERELDDLLELVPLRLAALPGDGDALARRKGVVDEVEREAAIAQREAFDSPTVATPEADLARMKADAEDEGEVVRVAALAIEARRMKAADLAGAAERYEELRSSQFEPEATIALVRTIGDLSNSAAADGDVDGTRRAQRRLVELGEADEIDAALAVSAALHAAGNLQGALEELAAVEDIPADSSKRDLLEQSLGDLELAAGDAEAAGRHFDVALELARDRHDLSRVAQLETRAAIAKLVGGSYLAASGNVLRAIRAWREAGAFEPLWTVAQEARAVLAQAAGSEPVRRAVTSLLEHVQSGAAEAEAASPSPATKSDAGD